MSLKIMMMEVVFWY